MHLVIRCGFLLDRLMIRLSRTVLRSALFTLLGREGDLGGEGDRGGEGDLGFSEDFRSSDVTCVDLSAFSNT